MISQIFLQIIPSAVGAVTFSHATPSERSRIREILMRSLFMGALISATLPALHLVTSCSTPAYNDVFRLSFDGGVFYATYSIVKDRIYSESNT